MQSEQLRLLVRRGIAVVEVTGGVWGLIRTGQRLWRPGLQPVALLIVVIISILFLLLLVAGLLLWSGRRGGVAMSTVMHLVQLPHIVTTPFGFFFGSPISLSAGFELGGVLKVNPIWNPSVGFALDSEVEVSWIGINLVALLVLMLLLWLGRRPAAARADD